MRIQISAQNYGVILAGLAALSLAAAPAALAEEADPALGNAISCQPGEDLVFAGEVEDDFGLSVAVCLEQNQADPDVIVHYSGEGGTRTVSCKPSQCSGTIDFSHYVRPRFTILTLTWRDENGEQRLTETFDAQSFDTKPLHHVSHSWEPIDAQNSAAQPEGFPVNPQTDALSLLRLEHFFAR